MTFDQITEIPTSATNINYGYKKDLSATIKATLVNHLDNVRLLR